MPSTTTPVAERLARSSEREGACLLWTGCLDRDGRGRIWHEGGTVGAHHLAWSEAFGPLPPRAIVRQTCGRLTCIEPTHLTAEALPVRSSPGAMTSARLPVDMVTEARARARAAGVTFTDVLTAALAAYLARP